MNLFRAMQQNGISVNHDGHAFKTRNTISNIGRSAEAVLGKIVYQLLDAHQRDLLNGKGKPLDKPRTNGSAPKLT